MKKTASALLALLMVSVLALSALPALADGYYYGIWYAASDYNNESYPLYEVMSTSPNGYCYLYSEASDSSSNQGRYNNGEQVRVLSYDVENNYTLIVCANGKIGYVHTYAIQPVKTVQEYVYVYSTKPYGYAYLYSKASDSDWDSENLGRYDNCSKFELIDWDGYSDYAYVKSAVDGKYGYLHSNVIFTADNYPSEYEHASVWHSRGYVYLYSNPSSSDWDSQNMGRYNNGAAVVVLEWNGGNGFAFVKTMDNKAGYIDQGSLHR